MWGIEFVADKKTKRPFEVERQAAFRITMRAMENGLIIYPVTGCVDGRRGDGVLICPPLVIDNEGIAVLLELFEKTLIEATAEFGLAG